MIGRLSHGVGNQIVCDQRAPKCLVVEGNPSAWHVHADVVCDGCIGSECLEVAAGLLAEDTNVTEPVAFYLGACWLRR